MPQYKITDYTFTTAAELARAILEYAGVAYEDVRYDKDKAGDAEKGNYISCIIKYNDTLSPNTDEQNHEAFC